MNLKLLIDKIRYDKGLDLSDYKESILERRISRRLRFDGADSVEEYIRMLDKDQRLYSKLINDLFIKATEFFRDDDIWRLIKEEILTEIVRSKEAERQRSKKQIKPIIRIWSCGCADGREPYSLAICLEEVLKERGSDLEIKIFATDVDEEVISKARKGEYKTEDVSKLPNSLLEKYFAPLEIGCQRQSTDTFGGLSVTKFAMHKIRVYKIKKQIRNMLIFGAHNLVSDFYIADLDLIVCRNVLIYLQRELQDKVIMHFHRALREGGILWLGTAESLSETKKKMFKAIFKKERIFQKI